MRARTFISLVTLSLSIILQGCAAQATKEALLFWPSPPNEPRIGFLAEHQGSVTFKEYTFFDRLFGASSERDIYQPFGVTAHKGRIYLADTGQKVVVMIDPQTRSVKKIGQSSAGRLLLPLGVAVAQDGTLFVSDGALKSVYMYDSAGEFKGVLGTKGDFVNPSGIAVDNARGRVVIVDSLHHSVVVFSLKGEKLFAFGERGHWDGVFNYPSFVAVDQKSGEMYIVDTQNFRVQVFSADGKFLRKFGEIGDRPGSFARPKGIAIDSEGHIYVADAAFDNFQVFDRNGKAVFFLGSAGTAQGAFQLPAGMFIDENDRIYVSDAGNKRVQVFQYFSEKWKKENPAEYGKYVRPDLATGVPSPGKK